MVGLALTLAFAGQALAEQPAVDAGDVVLMSVSDGTRDNVVIYHKKTGTILLYGGNNRDAEGIQLLQIRKVSDDLKLVDLLSDLPYRQKGYTVKEVKELIEEGLKRKAEEEDKKGKRSSAKGGKGDH
jgi:hypothetical protein